MMGHAQRTAFLQCVVCVVCSAPFCSVYIFWWYTCVGLAINNLSSMATAPDVIDETLQLNKAGDILDELIGAQNHSYLLGLKLNIPIHELDAILSTHSDPKQRLLQVIITFLKQATAPTWRNIIDALKTPSVNLPRLADSLETSHSTSTPSVAESTGSTGTAPTLASTPATSGISPPCSESSSSLLLPSPSHKGTPGPMSSQCVQDKIRELEKKFNELKIKSRECLQRCKITVKKVADALTSLPTDDVDEHKQFLMGHLSILYRASDLSELFGALSFNWNYLSYQLLEYLIKFFDLEVRCDMEAYTKELQQFRKTTPLTLFCRTQKRRHVDPPSKFQEVVAKFDWPDDVTLEVVEQFRQEYAWHYKLRECAMMLAEVRSGSFVISWFIPETIGENLKANIPRALLKKYSVTKLEIGKTCIYRSHEVQQSSMSLEEEYLFVEPPSEEFFCPVLCVLLLQPYLTECCGNHLSEEAATKIQEETKACPTCNATNWRTNLNKHFQRQVRALHVFCRHEHKGCDWRGELSDLERHVQSCPKGDTTDVGKPPEDVRKNGETANLEMVSSQSNTGAGTGKPLSEPTFELVEEFTVECHQEQHKIYRGSATTDDDYGYFTAGGSNFVYCYEWKTKKWGRRPPCPYSDSALVIIDGELTAVGGSGEDGPFSDKLFTLRSSKWVEEYPPMNIARSDSAVVSTSQGDYIIVIGGCTGHHDWDATSTVVELFEVRSRRWYKLTNLPQPLGYPSATICGSRIYVIGNGRNGYTCSLPPCDEPITSKSSSHLVSWEELPSLPVTDPTAATLHGQLVIVGGKPDVSQANTIYRLAKEKWEEIGSLGTDRWKCLVVSPSPDKMMIVGGYGALDSVEECSVV